MGRNPNYVDEANVALREFVGGRARCLSYTISHWVFELEVCHVSNDRNIVLCLAACVGVEGPEDWTVKDLRVVWTPKQNGEWWFELVDPSVAFRARGQVFEWATDHKGSLHLGELASKAVRGSRSDFQFRDSDK